MKHEHTEANAHKKINWKTDPLLIFPAEFTVIQTNKLAIRCKFGYDHSVNCEVGTKRYNKPKI